jgi:hypothetical protein
VSARNATTVVVVRAATLLAVHEVSSLMNWGWLASVGIFITQSGRAVDLRAMMDVTAGITRRIIGTSNPDSLSSRMRGARWTQLVERFPNLADMRVLDLGGTVNAWTLSPIQPAELTLLNTYAQDSDKRVIVGDACDPPEELLKERFDLVYSNSTIEHVGGEWRRQRFAAGVRALGEHWWIQTPYRYFPIEPHWLFPWFQHLPIAGKLWVVEHWPLGSFHAVLAERGHDAAVEEVVGTELVSRTDMARYFPTSEIITERVGGLTKSLIAVS